MYWKRKKWEKYMGKRFKRLKAEMKEISKEQERIKEGQRQVGAKLKAMEKECEQVREETRQILEQSANTQIRLALMLNILKAREQRDFAKAAHFTRLLREIVAGDNCKNEGAL
ncbi:hypothetical protein DITRI_Ditri12bG0004200 [Diplodiscus trichospermus]